MTEEVEHRGGVPPDDRIERRPVPRGAPLQQVRVASVQDVFFMGQVLTPSIV